MRKTIFGLALLGAALASGTGCGDGGSGGSGGTGGGGGGEGGQGGSTAQLLNGCDAAKAEDHTADATTTVTQAALKYTPACIKIAAGNAVTWEMDFGIHPLVGGTVEGSTKTPDSSSPITASSGTTVTITFPNAGEFPYYCDIHAGTGMAGVVYVE
jgi:plastocyanin